MADTNELRALADDRFDVIIVGGGMQGLLIALEASQQGWRCLVLEAGQLCSAASGASLRIIHGGLRYLQSFDFRRSLASADAQAWFHNEFEDWVQLRQFVLPLDGGMRNPVSGAVASSLQRISARLTGLGVETRPRVLGSAATSRLMQPFGAAARSSALLWQEIWIPAIDVLAVEIRRRIVDAGSVVIDNVRADALLIGDRRIEGVTASSLGQYESLGITGRKVIEATGPGKSVLRHAPVNDLPQLMAFNLVFDHSINSSIALGTARSAVTGQSYFAIPQDDRLVIGTAYCPLEKQNVGPNKDQIGTFLDDFNDTQSGLSLRPDQLHSVLWGAIPQAGSKVLTPATEDFLTSDKNGIFDNQYLRVCPAKLTSTRIAALQAIEWLRVVW
ncbi:MAG: FAD-dependent oxidoreductase [Pseudomonadota bacterium]